MMKLRTIMNLQLSIQNLVVSNKSLYKHDEMKYFARTANFKIVKNYEKSQKSQKNFQLETECSSLNALVIMENFSRNEVVDEIIHI